ncbi:hypothetical protein Nepgr_021021 [Nepenthes gracilis]|uniref:Uncharacterized protein n=1 Tax=Nepenthes gracilis TaxID=150966 RepID=A0AAD3SXY2_NEPGR|nr:hypothetical protein Nepgr_021021 [Nepenthes gracilis]
MTGAAGMVAGFTYEVWQMPCWPMLMALKLLAIILTEFETVALFALGCLITYGEDLVAVTEMVSKFWEQLCRYPFRFFGVWHAESLDPRLFYHIW